MRAYLGILAVWSAAACAGPSENGDDDDDDDGQHHQSFLLDVTLIDRDDQPVSGAIVATSVGQELVGVSLVPTDVDGRTQVNARIGALITAYSPATTVRPVRLTTLVFSAAPLTLRSVHMITEGVDVQAQVTGLSPGAPACLLDDAGQKAGVANGSGIFEAVPSYLPMSLEADGEATVIAMTGCHGAATRWGASRNNPPGSIAQLTLATDLSTLAPSITVEARNVGEYGFLSANYLGQHVELLNFRSATVATDASIALSAPGRDIADSLRVYARDIGADGADNYWTWQFPLSTAPEGFEADLTDLSFHLVSVAFVVTGTSGALELEVDGGADAVAISMMFGGGAWELLLPAADALSWSIGVPPIPVSLATEFPPIASQPVFAAARVIDVDFVDSPEELWRIRSRRTPQAFQARWRSKSFGTGYMIDFFP